MQCFVCPTTTWMVFPLGHCEWCLQETLKSMTVTCTFICLLFVVYVCDTHASVSEGMSRGTQGSEKSEAALRSPFFPAVSFWGWTQAVRLVFQHFYTLCFVCSFLLECLLSFFTVCIWGAGFTGCHMQTLRFMYWEVATLFSKAAEVLNPRSTVHVPVAHTLATSAASWGCWQSLGSEPGLYLISNPVLPSFTPS